MAAAFASEAEFFFISLCAWRTSCSHGSLRGRRQCFVCWPVAHEMHLCLRAAAMAIAVVVAAAVIVAVTVSVVATVVVPVGAVTAAITVVLLVCVEWR